MIWSTSALFAVGCFAPDAVSVADESAAQETAVSDETLITAYLTIRGFDPATVQIQGERVIVEQDMVFKKQHLLEEARSETPKAFVESGIRPSGRPGGPWAYNFGGTGCLIYNAEVPQSWRDAVHFAAAQWRAEGFDLQDDCKPRARFSPYWIEVSYYDFGHADAYTMARADVGYPVWGESLDINSGVRNGEDGRDEPECGEGGSEGIPEFVKRSVMMHELGHSLGLNHPGEGKHLEETSDVWDVESVMLSGCSHSLPGLSDDDKQAALVLLGKVNVRPE